MRNSGGLVETFLLSNIHYYNLSYAIKTSNNKIALCGNGRKFNETSGGGYLTLITQSGELLWTTRINDDDPTTTESITSVAELQNGYYVAVGTVRSNVTLNLPYKLFVVLINNNGLIEKSRVFDNYYEDGSTENPVICSNNETALVSATISPYYTGPRSIWLLKIDNDCDTLWTKPLTIENASCGVGSITKTNTGHFILSGNAVIPNSTSPYPAFLAKIDSNGTQLWSNTFSGATSTSFTYCKESVDGGLAAIGQTISNGLFRIYFVKTDTAGLITSTWQPGAVAGRLTVSPNPVTDVCYVTLPQGCRQLNLLTLQGQTLLTINTTGKSTLELSTNWLPAGLYLLRAETPSGCMIEKILKLKP
ncbi:MAG: T9SS type A sorting domain-containing protein [Bacteroidales bacterium]|nr:T9SS type A sorting domain-containing protein [Bacteroidales bacterium]MDD3666640.1 T9SS type A sorting domain-containing protein [Bacteroidales bacterium]